MLQKDTPTQTTHTKNGGSRRKCSARRRSAHGGNYLNTTYECGRKTRRGRRGLGLIEKSFDKVMPLVEKVGKVADTPRILELHAGTKATYTVIPN